MSPSPDRPISCSRVKSKFNIIFPDLKRICQHLFVFLGCIHMVGGPYSVVQLYAWANMLITYSQQTTISEALADTFSGEKPCHLCEKISQAKTSDPKNQDSEPVQISQKLFQELFSPALVGLNEPISSPIPPVRFPAVAETYVCVAHGPPVPPPRA